VFGRAVAGPGGAIGAAIFNIAVSAAFTLFVGPIVGQGTPHFSTYLPAAACVELAALVGPRRRPGTFVLASTLLIATVGTLGEWGWTHAWMPIAWPAHFVPSAIAISLPAALCGALVGMFVAGSLATGRIAPLSTRAWLPGAIGAVGFAAILAFCVPTHAPARASATIALDHVTSSGGTRTAQATIAIHPAATVSNPDYVQQLSWQGHTKSIDAALHRIGPGVYRTAKPLPLSGSWKSLIRIQQGRMRGDVPVFMPADPAIPALGIPALTRVTRPFVSDTTLMQRERKHGIPGWLWSTAMSVVLAIIAVLLVIMGWGLARVGARARATPPATPSRWHPRLRRRRPVLAPSGAGR
jgi:hypothetical protein